MYSLGSSLTTSRNLGDRTQWAGQLPIRGPAKRRLVDTTTLPRTGLEDLASSGTRAARGCASTISSDLCAPGCDALVRTARDNSTYKASIILRYRLPSIDLLLPRLALGIAPAALFDTSCECHTFL